MQVSRELLQTAKVVKFSKKLEETDLYTCMAPATYNLIAWHQFFFTKDLNDFPESKYEVFKNMLIELAEVAEEELWSAS